MLNSHLFRRLFLPYLALICGATGLVGFFAGTRLRSAYLDRTRSAMSVESELVGRLLSEDLREGRFGEANRMVGKLHGETEARITVVKSDGVVVADSNAAPDRMENHSQRPEILEASGTNEGSSIRHSATVNEEMFYFARRIEVGRPEGTTGEAPAEGAASGVFYIRLARRLADLDSSLRQLYQTLGAVVLLAMVLGGAICYLVARRHALPLLELTGFADALSRGELNRRLLTPGKGEVGTLGRSLNTMADSLSRLFTQTRQDKAELLTILASMSEGVIATDLDQRILLVNEAASRLLGFESKGAAGKRLWEVVRQGPILQSAVEVMKSGTARVFAIGPLAGRHLEITVCAFASGRTSPSGGPSAEGSESSLVELGAMRGRDGAATKEHDMSAGGLIIVAHDTTQSVQYQELRKEFVANVSHELRTPLSIIKGFAETLGDGALKDEKKGPKYLRIIEKHVDQLTNLVNDLLELSKLESQQGIARRTPVDMGGLVRKVREMLMPTAEKKRHALTVKVSAGLPQVVGDAAYLERAIVNLVDNALKYTPEGGAIEVSAFAEGDAMALAVSGESAGDGGFVVVEVSDNGIGIPEADLPRIFERFYRVDRSRSREMGGTGLGLSIVKHVAQSHGGRIEVTSVAGEGARFRLWLPARLAMSRAAGER